MDGHYKTPLEVLTQLSDPLCTIADDCNNSI
jgi:hypothetical protein